MVVDEIDLGRGWDAVGARVEAGLHGLPTQRDAIVHAVRERSPGLLDGLAFGRFRQGAIARVPTLHASETGTWFMGDLHGDLLALEAALAAIDAVDPGGRLVLLGDLIDDGDTMVPLVLRVMQRMVEAPDRIALLAGNHDEALHLSPVGLVPEAEHLVFASRVSPGEFADVLNHDPALAPLGRTFIALIAAMPRALFFSDGLLATHAGFPHSDLWASLGTPGDLSSPQCCSDYAWLRLAPTAPRKRPNRHTLGASFGSEDFDGFCAVATRVLGQPVSRMVRGHDHIDAEDRIWLPERWEGRALTLNAMSYRLPREPISQVRYVRRPVIARYRPGALPEPFALSIPEDLVRRFHPEPERAPFDDPPE